MPNVDRKEFRSEYEDPFFRPIFKVMKIEWPQNERKKKRPIPKFTKEDEFYKKNRRNFIAHDSKFGGHFGF